MRVELICKFLRVRVLALGTKHVLVRQAIEKTLRIENMFRNDSQRVGNTIEIEGIWFLHQKPHRAAFLHDVGELCQITSLRRGIYKWTCSRFESEQHVFGSERLSIVPLNTFFNNEGINE